MASPFAWLRKNRSLTSILALALALAAAVVVALRFNHLGRAPRAGSPAPAADAWNRPPVRVQVGKIRPPLPYRIVSFHGGRADRRLIRLAHQLGFNGVQIQIEGSTVEGLSGFAAYDASEGLIDFCHGLGMKVTIWVHELSDVPAPWLPEHLGPVSTDNQRIWSLLNDRYERVLGELIPKIDGLVLTVVETQINATDTPVMLKLVGLLRDKCRKYNKDLIVRTFVWYPEEFAAVMRAIAELPGDTIVMSKCVPQDWQMRGAFAAEIGKVGGRPQIVEYDVAGEYFLKDSVANCMPELLKKHFDYGLSRNVSGICVRVDRGWSSILHQPAEVNLWALGMLACGATDSVADVWAAWAANRFNAAATPAVIKALKPTQDVVAEMLSIGPFTFGDTRYFTPLGDEPVFDDNWQNWRWDTSYRSLYDKAEVGDEAFTAEVASAKARAAGLAEQCLADLEAARPNLAPADYAILRTKLLTNQVQLRIRSAMALAVLHYRRLINASNNDARAAADGALQQALAEVRAAALPVYPKPREMGHLGQKWWVGPPHDVWRDCIYKWAWDMDKLRQGEDPRPAKRPSRL